MQIDQQVIKDAEKLNIAVGGEFCQQGFEADGVTPSSGGRWRGFATEKIGNTRYATTKPIYTTEEEAHQGVVELVQKMGRPLTVAEQAAKVGELKDRNAELEAEIASLKAAAQPDVPAKPREIDELHTYEPIETKARTTRK